ncbi:hypothetical protein [Paenibacillus taiwanensis]|uniref:hypothetical protein n=1 Tax=Paenibacillus taiwanensis TaxID=401638 RepID=UPI00042541D1|nr:hypothetical protein [Paenibacillus taiwanensis]
MSDSNMPNLTPNSIHLQQDEDILLTIAQEELELAEIINEQGELIQQAVGTLPGGTPASTISDLLVVNTGVQQTIDEVTDTEVLLLCDLDVALGVDLPANSAIITNLADIVVAENGLISLDTNRIINGTDISHTPGSTDVILAANRTYRIIYSANGIPTLGTTAEVCTALLLDNIEIPHSQDCSILVAGDAGVAAAVTIRTGAVAQTLQIVNQTVGGATFTALAPELSNVCLRIVEIDVCQGY